MCIVGIQIDVMPCAIELRTFLFLELRLTWINYVAFPCKKEKEKGKLTLSNIENSGSARELPGEANTVAREFELAQMAKDSSSYNVWLDEAPRDLRASLAKPLNFNPLF